MTQQMVRIGNSVGVIIPKSLRRELGLRPGSRVQVDEKAGKIVVTPAKKKLARGVDAKFMKMVDEFMEEHKDVLEELARR